MARRTADDCLGCDIALSKKSEFRDVFRSFVAEACSSLLARVREASVHSSRNSSKAVFLATMHGISTARTSGNLSAIVFGARN
jgi:hypothetical protein